MGKKDIIDAELALTGYVMFRKDRRERRGGGVILYIKESIRKAIRKIAHKPMLWRIYKHTGNVEDYTNYKALNLATTEIRKSKRTFEKNWQVI